MYRFTKGAAITGVVIFAAGSAWAQAYTPNPAAPGPYAATPGTSYSGQTTGQGTDGLTPFERAKQELRKDGYKFARHWTRSAQGWSAEAVRNGQNVHVVVGDNGQIATSPAQ